VALKSEFLSAGTLSEQIYGVLRQHILGGQYAPGERLVETELAKQMNVSQAPVRDALRKLAEVGLVDQRPRRGTFVAGVTQKAAVDALHVRAALEPLAAKDLLQHVDAEIIEELANEARKMLDAAKEGDLAGVLECDIAFHRIVWWRSQNDLLPKVWPMVEKIWPLLEARVRSSADPSNPLYYGDLTSVAMTHLPLIQALQNRDPETPEIFRQHVTQVWSGLESMVSTAGD
jgi:DNA-binding GntR family transcriptional regulator